MASGVDGTCRGELFGLDLEQVDETVCRVTPGGIRDEGHRGGLVEEPKFSPGFALQGRIPEDPAVLEHLIVVPHEGSAVPDLGTELLELCDEHLDRGNPLPSRAAEAVDLRLIGYLQVLGRYLEAEVRAPSDKAKPL